MCSLAQQQEEWKAITTAVMTNPQLQQMMQDPEAMEKIVRPFPLFSFFFFSFFFHLKLQLQQMMQDPEAMKKTVRSGSLFVFFFSAIYASNEETFY